MWLGLLFAIMTLSASYQLIKLNDPTIPNSPATIRETQKQVQCFNEKTVQCLVLGRYTKCVPYTIETLTLYFGIEASKSEDAQVGVWVLLGMVIRLAMRMGYHRDASHFPRFSAFEAEMRRRVWATVVTWGTPPSDTWRASWKPRSSTSRPPR